MSIEETDIAWSTEPASLWRCLEKDETVQPGDQARLSEDFPWEPVHVPRVWTLSDGTPIEGVQFRRFTKEIPTEAQIANWCRQAFNRESLQQDALKFAEEAGEIAGAVNKIPEGRATWEDLEAEIGDALIVLSSMATKLTGKTLEEIRTKRFRFIVNRHTTKQQTWPENQPHHKAEPRSETADSRPSSTTSPTTSSAP